jgi:glycylpeptide N-tetradecanoyltransferase
MLIYRAIETMEINFLCVKQNERSRRLAPILITEVARRSQLIGVQQAIYTASMNLSLPIARTTYYHRILNGSWFEKKEIKIDSLDVVNYLASVDEEYNFKRIRPMKREDIPEVTAKLTTYLNQFPLHPIFTEAEVAHWFLPRNDAPVKSFVVVDEKGRIKEFASFYCLGSQMIESKELINAAYAFYYFVSNEKNLPLLMDDMLKIAKEMGFEIFNFKNVMTFESFLPKDMRFLKGDGVLQYYLYNWNFSSLSSDQIGLIMK